MEWKALRTVDQVLSPRRRLSDTASELLPFDPGADVRTGAQKKITAAIGEQGRDIIDEHAAVELRTVGGMSAERQRTTVYEDLRGNMPVVELVPSIRPGFDYEARVRVAPHKRSEKDVPALVIWTAGPNFEKMARCPRDQNPDFEAWFGYYDPMLIQARMYFDDGAWALGYAYAYLPGTELPAPTS